MSGIDHNSNSMRAALNAALNIHTAICLFPEGHAGQGALLEAMHYALIGAEECRQAYRERFGDMASSAAAKERELRALLGEFVNSGVEHDQEGVPYVGLQVPRELLADARKALNHAA